MQTKLLTIWMIILVPVFSFACQIVPTSTTPTIKPPPTIETQSKSAGKPIRLGVLSIRSANATQTEFGGIIAYLEQQTGRPFELIPLSQEEQFNQIESGEIDFLFSNPLSSVQIQRLYGTELLATFLRSHSGAYFGGLILVHSNSDIHTIEDLHGKNGTCVNHQTAAGGCIFQVNHLRQRDIDPFSDFANFTETPSQDNIVLGVLNGTFDVGFIRTGQLEQMLQESVIISLADFRIIDESNDDFYYRHTTSLYPEWAVSAHPQTDPELATLVKKTLVDMPIDQP
ncbi:MAG: phosphate/phosphite/phosphonate ABC transporter substrate-binding protein [Chloroflexota bacterium]